MNIMDMNKLRKITYYLLIIFMIGTITSSLSSSRNSSNCNYELRVGKVVRDSLANDKYFLEAIELGTFFNSLNIDECNHLYDSIIEISGSVTVSIPKGGNAFSPVSNVKILSCSIDNDFYFSAMDTLAITNIKGQFHFTTDIAKMACIILVVGDTEGSVYHFKNISLN
jgi:hypothetical protein